MMMNDEVAGGTLAEEECGEVMATVMDNNGPMAVPNEENANVREHNGNE